jgi:hypothetical protein
MAGRLPGAWSLRCKGKARFNEVKRFFFEKKNQKTFDSHAPGGAEDVPPNATSTRFLPEAPRGST